MPASFPEDLAQHVHSQLVARKQSPPSVNPARIHLTVPMSARLRREHPEWIVVHRANLSPQEINRHEGMPVTSVDRSVMDVFSTTHRADIVRVAITDARRTGLLTAAKASILRRRVNHAVHGLSPSTN